MDGREGGCGGQEVGSRARGQEAHVAGRTPRRLLVGRGRGPGTAVSPLGEQAGLYHTPKLSPIEVGPEARSGQ